MSSTNHVRMNDPVARVMTWPVATVDTDASLAEVIEALAADEIGALGVLSDHRFVGLVSERDVVTHLAQGAHPDHVTAGEAMTTDLVMVGPSDSILDAAVRMDEAEVRHLPVLAEGTGALVGFVSMRDLLGVLLHTARGTAAAVR